MKKIIKETLIIIITALVCYLIYDNKDIIGDKLIHLYVKYLQPDIKQTLVDNEYRKNENYQYVKINENFKLNNLDDIKNSIYTFLDAGWDKYILQCNPDYIGCENDFKTFLENETTLSYINGFVHPFNSYNHLDVKIDSSGKIFIEKTNLYTDLEISETSKKVDEIYNKLYDKNKSERENIKTFHDYIIKNTTYDKNQMKAYDILINNKGNCSAYSSAMALFLNKMNIKNYIITSDTHAWNMVYIDNSWKHLDLTWDDVSIEPVYTYFLIDSEVLHNNDKSKEHNFDNKIYLEAQ